MRKTLRLTKMLLVALFMAIGATSVSAYTPALKADYVVAGYKAKAFYNIANTNVDDMLPKEGDLRFRGSGYGLFNYGSGGRAGNITMSVAESDLIIFEYKDTQNRGVVINSVSGCTKNATLSSGDFYAYDVDTDLSQVTVNIGRGGCIIAILVMEKDASIETADYSISYKLEGTTIKESTGNIAVGSKVSTDASFFKEDVKYIRVDGQPESFDIVSGTNNYTVEVRLAETFNYSLTDNVSEIGIIMNGSGLEGDVAYLPYSRYQISYGKLYEANVTNKEYRKTITLTENNMRATVSYEARDSKKAVFFAEGENIEGMTLSTYGNIPVRASGAKAATSSEDIVITTLPAGTYKLHVGIFTSKSKDFNENSVVKFGIGDNVFTTTLSAGNLTEFVSEEYTLDAESEVKYLGTSSWSDAQFDYIWIENTGLFPLSFLYHGFATLVSPYALDFSTTTTKAYTAKVRRVERGYFVATLTQVAGDQVPANTPVVLYSNGKNDEDIPVVTSAPAIVAESDLVAGTGTTIATTEGEDENEYTNLILNDIGGIGFYLANNQKVGADKAYLHILSSVLADVDDTLEARLMIIFADSETTGIGATLVNSEVVNNEIYNLAGQRVAAPKKGLYIVGGKKVMVK